MKYRVKLTATTAEMFNNLHPRHQTDIKRQLKTTLKELYKTPYLGKSLQNELIGLKSLKMKRYRTIYQIDDQNKTIIIYTIGLRKDIYEVITELVL